MGILEGYDDNTIIEVTKMIYDSGFHIDINLSPEEVQRIFCSKKHKCKCAQGRTDWCNKTTYAKAENRDRKIIFIGPIKDIPYKAILVLYGKEI